MLAGVGLAALSDEAEANHCKRCRRLPSRKRRQLCVRRCRRVHRRQQINQINQINHLTLSTPIGVGVTLVGGVCLTNEACQSGNCLLGLCAPCLGIRLCGDACCLVNASCVAGLCVVPGGLLG